VRKAHAPAGQGRRPTPHQADRAGGACQRRGNALGGKSAGRRAIPALGAAGYAYRWAAAADLEATSADDENKSSHFVSNGSFILFCLWRQIGYIAYPRQSVKFAYSLA